MPRRKPNEKQSGLRGCQDLVEQRESLRAGVGRQEGTGGQHLPASRVGEVLQQLTQLRTMTFEAQSGEHTGTGGHGSLQSQSRLGSKKMQKE